MLVIETKKKKSEAQAAHLIYFKRLITDSKSYLHHESIYTNEH